MIRLEGVSRFYGKHAAVRDLDFSLERGELTAFLGPNGAGKTTTMRMITGVIAPHRGRVLLAGEDVHRSKPELRNRIGYLPENCPLYEDMTPLELLEGEARLRGMPRGSRRAAIRRVIDRCGLFDTADQVIGTLSKGYRQRVGLARVLIHDPEVLILDEPTTGLDPNQIRDIQNLICELGETRTVLLSTHLLHQVPRICDKVLVLCRGQLVFEGHPEELGARDARRQVLIRTSLGPEKMAAILSPHSIGDHGTTGNLVEYRVRGDVDDATLTEWARAIHEAGGRLAHLAVEQASLETVFAAMTESEQAP